MVVISDDYIIPLVLGIFIPLFVFLVKMIITSGNATQKIEVIEKDLNDHLHEVKPWQERIAHLESENELKKYKIEQLSRTIEDLRRKHDRDYNNELVRDGKT